MKEEGPFMLKTMNVPGLPVENLIIWQQLFRQFSTAPLPRDWDTAQDFLLNQGEVSEIIACSSQAEAQCLIIEDNARMALWQQEPDAFHLFGLQDVHSYVLVIQ